MEIYLIRHTKPKIGEGYCYGRTDLEVEASFSEELAILEKKLPDSFDVLYSSPARRCKILAEKLKTKEFHYDDRILELNFGDWENKKWTDIDPVQAKKWWDDFVDERAPNGETFRELSKRVMDFMDELKSKNLEKVGVVSHAGVIRTIVANLLDMPLLKAFNLSYDFGKVTLVSIKGETKIIRYINQ